MEWPLTCAALLFLVAYALPILHQGLGRTTRHHLEVLTWLLWGLFVVDYVMRWRLSHDRRQFLRSTVPDLLVIVLPVLRPLRALRLVTLLGLVNRHISVSLRGRVAMYVAGATGLVVFCAALAVLDAERHNPRANIVTFTEALWWAISTITTVGYGDFYPTTFEGRIVAGFLMLGGIALLGLVTASLASWLLERVREVEVENRAATQRDISALSRQIEELRAELQRDRQP